MTSRETFKNIQKKIQGTIPEKIRETLSSDLSQKIQTQVSEKLQATFGERWTQSAEKVSQATSLATETAKMGLKHALAQLEQQGLDVNDPKAFAQSVGEKALERAERIRLALVENPFSPAWLRDVSFAPQPPQGAEEGEMQESRETSPAEATATGSIVESVISEPAEDMQPGHETLAKEKEAASDEGELSDDLASEDRAQPKRRKSSRGSKGSGSSRVSH